MNRRGIRTALAAAAVTIAALAVMATVSTAAQDGSIKGKFVATVRAVDASFVVDTSPVKRAYGFDCLNGKCSRIEFKREAGDGFYKSKLNEKNPGVFEGTERAKMDDCPDSDGTSDRLVDHKVTITKASKSGKARELKGTAYYSWPDCDGEPWQKTKFTAVRK